MLNDAFGDVTGESQATWKRSPGNPVVTAASGDWSRDFIAPCSLVERCEELWLYTEGSAGGHEQIGLFTASVDDPSRWTPSKHNPVLRIGEEEFDRGGVFDPAVVRFRGQWLMYFSATEGDAHEYAEQLTHGKAPESPVGEWIGLATSDDGVHFVKHDGPIIDARCPFAVVHDNRVHLFFVRVVDGGYRIYLTVSDDGVTFRPVRDVPVLDVGESGSWDSFSVTTPKVFRDGDRFCMSFAGDQASLDDPTGIGLAYSHDLVHWEKVAGNPVFKLGAHGEFDSVSVASPVIHKVGNRYVMLYAGSDRTIFDGLHSQVGMAWALAQ